jgi:hypothetical protein
MEKRKEKKSPQARVWGEGEGGRQGKKLVAMNAAPSRTWGERGCWLRGMESAATRGKKVTPHARVWGEGVGGRQGKESVAMNTTPSRTWGERGRWLRRMESAATRREKKKEKETHALAFEVMGRATREEVGGNEYRSVLRLGRGRVLATREGVSGALAFGAREGVGGEKRQRKG